LRTRPPPCTLPGATCSRPPLARRPCGAPWCRVQLLCLQTDCEHAKTDAQGKEYKPTNCCRRSPARRQPLLSLNQLNYDATHTSKIRGGSAGASKTKTAAGLVPFVPAFSIFGCPSLSRG
jgi:hypothetical protein